MTSLLKFGRQILALIAFTGIGAQAQATLVYDSWSSNTGGVGNFVLTVDHVGSQFTYNLTASPWTAEALGLFIDLGAISVSNVNLNSASPSGQVALVGTDTSSTSCGSGCNLSGLALPALAGGDWELVFRLGSTGFDGIQTFSWKTSDFGLDLDSFGLIAIRGQQLCSGDDTLPSDVRDCGGSVKAYGHADTPNSGNAVPEPGALVLFALGLLSVLALQSRRVR